MSDDDFAKKLDSVARALAGVERLLAGAELEAARDLVTAILDVHRDALEELLEAVGARREGFVDVAFHPRVAWLLGFYGANPAPLERRAREALRAASAAPGGSGRAELSSVEGEHVRIRITGGTEEGQRLLVRAIERAMNGLAPEAEVAFEKLVAEPALLPAERLLRRRELRSS